MEKLGYVPNVAAQILASGLTHCIGVVLPPLDNHDRFGQPFFMEILTAIISSAKEKNYTVSIAVSASFQELESQVKLMYLQRRVDGFIVLYSEENDPTRKFLMDNKVPFVVLGVPEGYENEVTYVDNDNKLMAKTAVDYLYSNGHKNILFVTDDKYSDIYSERFSGYIKGIKKHDLAKFDSLIYDRYDPKSVQNLISIIRNEDISALIIIDDMLSVRIIQYLNKNGLAVPEDVSIVSFNNSVYSKIIKPYLTTFDINISSLGITSLERLLDRIENPNKMIEKVIVPFSLKERESVLKIQN